MYPSRGRVQSPNFQTFNEPSNRFQGINSASLCSLAGLYVNPIPMQSLAPTDWLKNPPQGEDSQIASYPSVYVYQIREARREGGCWQGVARKLVYSVYTTVQGVLYLTQQATP